MPSSKTKAMKRADRSSSFLCTQNTLFPPSEAHGMRRPDVCAQQIARWLSGIRVPLPAYEHHVLLRQTTA